MEPHYYVQPRSLHDIAAECLASTYTTALKNNQLLTDPERDIDLWKEFPKLQERSADCVYDFMHKQSLRLRPVIRSAILVPFSKPNKTILTKLDLSGFVLTENLLAKVLTAQKDSLRSIKAYDMDYTHTLDMYHVCKYLKESKVKLERLEHLATNQLHLLMEPKFQAHQVRHSMLPMFSDISFENYHNGGPSTSALNSLLEDAYNEEFFPVPTLTENMSFVFGGPSFAVYPPVKNVMPHLLSFMPNLQKLQIGRDQNFDHFMHIPDPNELLLLVTQHATKLKCLDICSWPPITDSRFMTFFRHGITHLLLRDVANIEAIAEKIGQCSSLIYLDVSYDTRDIRTNVDYQKPNTCLFYMTKDLKNLQYLDISGTNLHMTGNANDIIPESILKENSRVKSDIVGLRGLHQNLKVLGLYGCEHAGDLPNLPAERIFSNCNESQLVNAMEVYLNRQTSLYHAMNEAYHMYRNNTNCTHAHDAMLRLIAGMEKYELDTNMITAGTAAIFYILRKLQASHSLRRYIARVLIKSLENMYHDQIVVRNVALTLCQFDFAGDVIDDYAHVMEYILKSMRIHNSDTFTNRVIIYLMNSMACFLNGEQRSRVGEIGAIRVIMNEIIRRRENLAADRVLEACWSFLWNITDETPKNCYRFIRGRGLELMISVYNLFPNELEIVRNMMGLLGNISEVKRFRKMIMEQPFVPTLLFLLQNTHANMEVAYNVAAVLANLMSDGENFWKFRDQQIQFKQVHNQIIKSVNEWDLQGSRIINYHSLRPIISLLYCDQSYASQMWAAWALANLLTTDNEKYGQIFTAEEGIDALIRTKKIFSAEATISKLLNKIEEKLRIFKPNIFDQYDMPKETNEMLTPVDHFERADDPPYIDDNEEPEPEDEEIYYMTDAEDDTEALDFDEDEDDDTIGNDDENDDAAV